MTTWLHSLETAVVVIYESRFTFKDRPDLRYKNSVSSSAKHAKGGFNMPRKEPLNKEEKNLLVILLKKLNIMPNRQGQVVIHMTPEQTIGRIQIQTDY